MIQHELPARRMEKDYLLRLYAGIGRGQAVVRRLYDWKARTPLAVLIAGKDFIRWFTTGHLKRFVADDAALARDLNDLERRLIAGRALQMLKFLG